MTSDPDLTLTVNGKPVTGRVPARLSLADYLRDRLGLTGTNVGCEQGVCGACTVLVDGRSMRACLMLAVQADGCAVRTVEGLAAPGRPWHPLQAAFDRNDALQCGFCTPGFLMAAAELLEQPRLSEPDVRAALSGNLCRCTGYEGIVRSVLEVHAANGGATAPAAPAARTRPFDDLLAEPGRRLAPALLTVAAVATVAGVLILRRRRRTT
jgi:aerobic-type carbon monoxide dehydrogenase small subunit (CoxS/CutS family)